MQIACLVMFHQQPEQLGRLLTATRDPRVVHHLHGDARIDLAPFRAAVPAGMTVTWAPRHVVRWGAFSQITASLALLRHALADPASTHFYLMSGRCLPIRPLDEVVGLVEDHPGDWMDAAVLVAGSDVRAKSLGRLDRLYLMDARSPRLRRAAHAVLRELPRRRVDRLLHGLTPYGGHQWWLLTRATAEAAVSWLAANPWYERAFRHTLCPDEAFFQTLLGALGRVPVNPCPTGSVWTPGDSSHPQPLTEERVGRLRADGHLFARKFPLGST